MPAQNDVEAQMQYKAPEPSQATPSQEQTEQEMSPVKKTILGMRGGGIILDLCACFICCEACDACCHAIDDCCCC